jgi:AraC-like DNA-binding protein
VTAVRDQLIALLPNGTPSESYIAKKLNISERTLQRKLKDQNCSFRELLATTRQSLAYQHLKNLNIPVNEISFLLGYSEEINFARAFKRWTGMNPSKYRNSNS